MKKLFLTLFVAPSLVFAQESGESCSKIEENTKRLECYDALFMKKENNKEETNTSKWEYIQKKDEMRNAINYRAAIQSNNSVDFGFPYGTSKAKIILRKHPNHGNDVMFSIISGQFNSCFDSCRITVKFDEQKLENYTMVGTDDSSSDLLFISGEKNIKRFTEKLRKSKKVIIEASFYDHGKEQFFFDTEGLDWKYF